MLVIHPQDRTTSMLAELYRGLDVQLLDQRSSNAVVSRSLHHAPKHELIMLLGHGSEDGLFSRLNDEQDYFDRKIVAHQHAYHLRKHGSNILAVWCNADKFAMKEGLHGLFSGMIITEMSEADSYHVATTKEELSVENDKIAKRLRSLLDENVPLCSIPERMLELDDVHSELTEFNYKNFFYL